MNDQNILDKPALHNTIAAKCESIGFTMASDLYIGTLLKTLITSKPGANILELGTGIGCSLAWMIDGMDEHSKILSIDNDPILIQIAEAHFRDDPRVSLLCADGDEWIKDYKGDAFDLIFADAWPGKFRETEATIALLKPGGFYIIDDMNTEPDWPEGHQEKVDRLIAYLENHEDLHLTKMNWSTGIIIATKKP